MQRATICFEGPSGVGKTAMCNLFSQTNHIIPEVNQLFQRNQGENKYWYLEKQVERYKLCNDSNLGAILDGDIFQPIWYNWIYDYPENLLSKDETYAFYQAQIGSGRIEFPDAYIIFQAPEEELRRRKEHDKNRQRRNFEKHLKLIGPQRRYFKFIESHTELEVNFIELSDLEKTRNLVQAFIKKVQKKKKDNLKIFGKIIDWIENHNV